MTLAYPVATRTRLPPATTSSTSLTPGGSAKALFGDPFRAGATSTINRSPSTRESRCSISMDGVCSPISRRDVRLSYAKASGQLSLRQLVLTAIADDRDGYRPGERRTLPLCPECRTLKVLHQDILRPDEFPHRHHTTPPPPGRLAAPGLPPPHAQSRGHLCEPQDQSRRPPSPRRPAGRTHAMSCGLPAAVTRTTPPPRGPCWREGKESGAEKVAFGVSSDEAYTVSKRAQSLKRQPRHRSHHEVAAHHDHIDAGRFHFRQHSVQRGQVPVDVIESRNSHLGTFGKYLCSRTPQSFSHACPAFRQHTPYR